MLTQADIAKIKRLIVAEIRQRSRKPPRIPRKTGNNSQSFDSKINQAMHTTEWRKTKPSRKGARVFS